MKLIIERQGATFSSSCCSFIFISNVVQKLRHGSWAWNLLETFHRSSKWLHHSEWCWAQATYRSTRWVTTILQLNYSLRVTKKKNPSGNLSCYYAPCPITGWFGVAGLESYSSLALMTGQHAKQDKLSPGVYLWVEPSTTWTDEVVKRFKLEYFKDHENCACGVFDMFLQEDLIKNN